MKEYSFNRSITLVRQPCLCHVWTCRIGQKSRLASIPVSKQSTDGVYLVNMPALSVLRVLRVLTALFGALSRVAFVCMLVLLCRGSCAGEGFIVFYPTLFYLGLLELVWVADPASARTIREVYGSVCVCKRCIMYSQPWYSPW